VEKLGVVEAERALLDTLPAVVQHLEGDVGIGHDAPGVALDRDDFQVRGFATRRVTPDDPPVLGPKPSLGGLLDVGDSPRAALHGPALRRDLLLENGVLRGHALRYVASDFGGRCGRRRAGGRYAALVLPAGRGGEGDHSGAQSHDKLHSRTSKVRVP
jgi:hypothetical protein